MDPGWSLRPSILTSWQPDNPQPCPAILESQPISQMGSSSRREFPINLSLKPPTLLTSLEQSPDDCAGHSLRSERLLLLRSILYQFVRSTLPPWHSLHTFSTCVFCPLFDRIMLTVSSSTPTPPPRTPALTSTTPARGLALAPSGDLHLEVVAVVRDSVRDA